MPSTHRFSRYFPKVVALLLIFLIQATAYNAMAENKVMPSFQVNEVGGTGQIKSEEYRDKVLIVYFWATWCPLCRRETKDFVELSKTYKSQEFQIVGFSVDKDGEKGVLNYMDKMKVNYPIAMASEKIKAEFGPITAIPTSFIIDKKGNIFKTKLGYMKHKQLVTDIEQLLAE